MTRWASQKLLTLKHLRHGRIETDGVDPHHHNAAIQKMVHTFLRHPGVIGEITLLETSLRRVGSQQNDVAWLDT